MFKDKDLLIRVRQCRYKYCYQAQNIQIQRIFKVITSFIFVLNEAESPTQKKNTKDKNNIISFIFTFFTFIWHIFHHNSCNIYTLTKKFSQFQFSTYFPVKSVPTKRPLSTKIRWESDPCCIRPLCGHRSGTQKLSSH